MSHTPMFVFLLMLLIASDGLAQRRTVKISDGTIEGIEEDGVSVFKGIPYAAAPTGTRRWKAPQPVKRWNGVLKCDRFSAIAMQRTPAPYQMWTEEFIPLESTMSEDCLYLNVWTSANGPAEKLPVIVWIHGGGFVAGSGSCPIYDGVTLAKKKIILVTINYRLGVFGFLAHPQLSKESGKNSSGNYGLLDQIAALQWVQKNIASFGGDANNVTVAGQSAGAISVHALILSPLARGLFQKAIVQSGGFSTDTASRQLGAVSPRGEKLAKSLGVKTIDELRKKTAVEIIKASEHFPFFPVYDGYVLPSDPIEHIKAKKHNDVPFISGWTTGDALIAGKKTMTAAEFKKDATTMFGVHTNEFLKVFPASNQAQTDRSHFVFSLCKFAVWPSYLLAIATKKKVFVYQFTFVPTDKPNFPNYGAFHSADIPFALNTLNKWDRPWEIRDRKLEQTMSTYWVNFARTGDPNGEGLPAWRNYQSTGAVIELGDQITERLGLFKGELLFLSNVRTK